MDLDAIPWRPTRYPGVAVHFYASETHSGRVLALIRMEPGRGYPRHQHRGEEHVLVLQGGYHDADGDHAAGEFVRYAHGTSHAPTALATPAAPACVLLALADEGILLLGS